MSKGGVSAPQPSDLDAWPWPLLAERATPPAAESPLLSRSSDEPSSYSLPVMFCFVFLFLLGPPLWHWLDALTWTQVPATATEVNWQVEAKSSHGRHLSEYRPEVRVRLADGGMASGLDLSDTWKTSPADWSDILSALHLAEVPWALPDQPMPKDGSTPGRPEIPADGPPPPASISQATSESPAVVIAPPRITHSQPVLVWQDPGHPYRILLSRRLPIKHVTMGLLLLLVVGPAVIIWWLPRFGITSTIGSGSYLLSWSRRFDGTRRGISLCMLIAGAMYFVQSVHASEYGDAVEQDVVLLVPVVILVTGVIAAGVMWRWFRPNPPSDPLMTTDGIHWQGTLPQSADLVVRTSFRRGKRTGSQEIHRQQLIIDGAHTPLTIPESWPRPFASRSRSTTWTIEAECVDHGKTIRPHWLVGPPWSWRPRTTNPIIGLVSGAGINVELTDHEMAVTIRWPQDEPSAALTVRLGWAVRDPDAEPNALSPRRMRRSAVWPEVVTIAVCPVPPTETTRSTTVRMPLPTAPFPEHQFDLDVLWFIELVADKHLLARRILVPE